MRGAVLILAAGCAACRTDVAIMTAVGVTAAVASRASGGCYAACPPGTACNPRTGMCDELPCRGRCADDERCDVTGLLPRCVRSGPAIDLGVGRKSDERGPTPPK